MADLFAPTSAPALTFNFAAQALRVIMRNDEPWFVAVDVCEALDIANSRDAISRLDDDEKGVGNTDTPGGRQEMSIINESGLYSLIMTSRKAEAKKFKKWVTSEVLPAIRKTGAYVPGNLTGQARVAATLQAADLFPRMLDSMARLGKNKRDQATAANEIVQSITGVDFLALAGNPHLNLDLFEAVPTRRHATDQHKQLDKLLAYIANGARYKENHVVSCDLQHDKEIVHAKLLKLMHLKKETFAVLIEQAIAKGLIARKHTPAYGGTIYVLTSAGAAA